MFQNGFWLIFKNRRDSAGLRGLLALRSAFCLTNLLFFFLSDNTVFLPRAVFVSDGGWAFSWYLYQQNPHPTL